jgi:hypothetical protein
MERGGTLAAYEHQWSGGGFTLPAAGVVLAVLAHGRELARLVLIGDPQVPVTLEERVVAVALADQLGSALALADPQTIRRIADAAGPSG